MNKLNYKNHYLNYLKFFTYIIQSNNFLKPNNFLPSDRFHIINDIHKADILYTMEYPLEELGEQEGSKYDIYIDLLNDRFNPHYDCFDNLANIEYKEYREFDTQTSEIFFEVVLMVEKENSYLHERFTDYVYNDILSFIPYLIFSDTVDKLIDLKIEAYINGAMPCGWYGKYPEGKLAVYVPLAE